MKDIFFQEKSKKVLLSLMTSKRKFVSEVTKDVDATYAHTFNLIKEMEELKIVSSKKEGRTKFVTLTSKGRELSKTLKQFLEILEGSKKSKTKAKQKKKPRTVEMTTSERKLGRYREALEEMQKQLKGKKIKKKDTAKYARLLGRYRGLVHRMRPRNNSGRQMKAEIIALIDEIADILTPRNKEV